MIRGWWIDYCLSEESFCLTHEESRGRAFSFAPRERLRSFQRATCKKCQEDKKIRKK